MSGPKCVRVRPTPRSDSRRANLNAINVSFAQWQRAVDRTERLRLQGEMLGLSSVFSSTPHRELRLIVENALADGRTEGRHLLQRLEQEKADQQAAARALEEQIRLRLEELQRRLRLFKENRTRLENDKLQLQEFVTTSLPTEWTDEERSRIQSILASILESAPTPGSIEFTANKREIAALEEAELKLANSINRVGKGRKELESALNEVHACRVSAKLSANASAPQSLEDFFRSHPSRVSTQSYEDSIADKLDALLAQIVLLQCDTSWTDLLAKATAIASEQDAFNRRLQYDALQIECSEKLSLLHQISKWQSELDALIDRATPFKGTAVDKVVTELQILRREGRVCDLSHAQQTLEATILQVEAHRQREETRHAVFESLAALGYEVEEGSLDTALVQAGKIIVRKSGERDYGVEVVANEDFSLVQTAMVRFADSPHVTDQQQLRDQEREEAWCGDHSRLLEKLAERGLETSWKLKIPSGEEPVRVIVRQAERQDRSALARSDESQQRSASPET